MNTNCKNYQSCITQKKNDTESTCVGCGDYQNQDKGFLVKRVFSTVMVGNVGIPTKTGFRFCPVFDSKQDALEVAGEDEIIEISFCEN
jgi:hypothetical protein